MIEPLEAFAAGAVFGALTVAAEHAIDLHAQPVIDEAGRGSHFRIRIELDPEGAR